MHRLAMATLGRSEIFTYSYAVYAHVPRSMDVTELSKIRSAGSMMLIRPLDSSEAALVVGRTFRRGQVGWVCMGWDRCIVSINCMTFGTAE